MSVHADLKVNVLKCIRKRRRALANANEDKRKNVCAKKQMYTCKYKYNEEYSVDLAI